MLKTYLLHTLQLLKEHKLLSFVSIAGTGLSIAMIMTILIVWQVQVAPCEPEINRDRTLYFDLLSVSQNDRMRMTSGLSSCFVWECLYPLEHVEKVSMANPCDQTVVSVPAQHKDLICDALQTDEAFFDIFHFRFLSGRKFIAHEIENAVPVAVVTESVARKLFGTDQVCGQTIEVMNSNLKIIGVVRDVSRLATHAYAQVWIPWSVPEDEEVWTEPWGSMKAFLLVKPGEDRSALRREIDDRIRKFTLSHGKNLYKVESTLDRPVTQFETLFLDRQSPDGEAVGYQAQAVLDVSGGVVRWGVIILILLVVPAVNLSGVTFSRMHERMTEFGVRKVFGAGKYQLVGQVLTENMITTLLGGVLGLGLSYVSVWMLKEWLLDTSVSFTSGDNLLNADMLFHPVIFLCAFLFCLVLNLLSAGIPAWIAAKSDIINALNGKL